MIAREHKINVLHNDSNYNLKNSTHLQPDSERESNKSFQNLYSQNEAINKFEINEQSNSRPNSARAGFETPLAQPYQTKSHEYYKSQITERRTYDCDENGELHIRIEPLPNEPLRPVTPVSPVIDYEIDEKKDPIYSNPTKFRPASKQQGILRSTSYLTKEPSKVPRTHPCNTQTKFQQKFDNELQNNYCKCNQCDNFAYNSYKNIQTLNNKNKKINNEEYKFKNNKEKIIHTNNKQNFNHSNQTSNYSPRYQRRYERSRTLSPRHEMYQNRKHERDWHCNVEVDNKQNSSSITDSGRSSGGSSFSPLSSNGSMSQLSAIGPLKKITRKSRFVSAYDGCPLTPFVTKVYYENINPMHNDNNFYFEKFKSWRSYREQEENDTWDITLNPLFIR